MSRLLIVDDEDVIRHSLRRLFERAGHDVEEAPSVERARTLPLDSFELIISDLRLPGEPGTAIITAAEGVPVIIMTSYASVRSAVAAMKEGAVDYISKPFDHEEMLLMVDRCLSRSRLYRQNAALKSDLQRAWPSADMIGDCAAMQAVLERIARVAPVPMPVLISGEAGTGKQLSARAIHDAGPRAQGPFIALNCGAVPDTSIEAELFGVEAGALPGEQERRRGRADAAHGGTLYLSRVDELGADAQARLLRLLEHSEVRAIGASHARRVDVRLIVSTEEDLAASVSAGDFRQDLYLGLRGLTIAMPPLRERGEDVLALAQRALARVIEHRGAAPLAFDPRALAAISAYHWPGNVRELENAVERALILCTGQLIGAELLGLDGAASTASPAPAQMSLDEYFRHFVLSNQGQMTETELAGRLGISRKALWERRQRMALPRRTR